MVVPVVSVAMVCPVAAVEPVSWLSAMLQRENIMLTCPCYFDPYTPLLWSKTGVYRGIHYFSYFSSKTWIVVTC